MRGVLIRDPAQRFDPQALRGTDLQQNPLPLVSWFVRRRPVEVTCQQARRTLGVETQPPWTQPAMARTTPCLLAGFSVVTLRADRLVRQGALPLPPDAWYPKARPPGADAWAAVRQHDGRQMGFPLSRRQDQVGKLPPLCASP
jgi:hypothetical protein